jgi:hypothetical protein
VVGSLQITSDLVGSGMGRVVLKLGDKIFYGFIALLEVFKVWGRKVQVRDGGHVVGYAKLWGIVQEGGDI